MSGQSAPRSLGPRGRRLWRRITADFELQASELELLGDAARTADLVDRLTEHLSREELIVDGSRGQSVVNPVAAELRLQRELLARLLGRLALPEEDDDDQVAAMRLGRRGAAVRWRGRRA